MPNLPLIEAFVSHKIGRDWRACAPPVNSSGRRKAQIIKGNGLSVFVKYAEGSESSLKVACEEQALKQLSQVTGVRTPNIIGVQSGTDESVLILEAITPVASGNEHWAKLGNMIASLHRESWDQFGLDHSNYIGDFPQDNEPSPSWNEFYLNQRICPMLHRVTDKGLLKTEERTKIDKVIEGFDSLAGPSVTPSLLHGDLWKGNVIFDVEGPLLIDPAISFGNREMDIAFGQMAPDLTFDASFYRAYSDCYPLPEGHEYRRGLWQMWPLLTHVVQDGRKWIPQLLNAIEHYL